MDHELICTWLGLPAKTWPPDHYTLLGLQPGDADCERIEQQVHERLARVRCYQLSHPGPATEAMNRIAQAFMCLTDRQAKRTYDAEHFPHLPPPEEPAPSAGTAQTAAQPAPARAAVLTPPAAPPARAAGKTADVSLDTGVVAPVQTQVDWKNDTPQPVRLLAPRAQLPPLDVSANGEPAPAAAVQPASHEDVASTPAAGVPRARPADPVLKKARSSPEARRGLWTRRAVLERILVTRRLLRAWERVGKYAGKPRRKLTRTPEETELTRLLTRIEENLQGFPPVLGQPGQPGYRLLALAQDEDPVAEFNNLGADEREALARDWLAGHTFLTSHRDFLRQQVKALRRQGWSECLARSLRASLNDHAGWVCFGLLLVIGLFLTVALLS